MIKLLAAILFAGLVHGGTVNRARRQAQTGCQEQQITNVCTQDVLQAPLHFPHPLDSTKFLQCAQGRRMFIIQCPNGEQYEMSSESCKSQQALHPLNPTTSIPSNPCTADNIARGILFFPYMSDTKKFIECSKDGSPRVLSCPSKLVYSASQQRCVLPETSGTGSNTGAVGTNTGASGTGTGGGATTGSNPCTDEALKNGQLFFAHPDTSKFFQCDLAGNVYIMQCPANLVWNQSVSKCDTPYHTNSGSSVLIG